jgi:hypothetical protein
MEQFFFKQYIPFGKKIYTLSGMNTYLGKDRQNATQTTHVIVKIPSRRAEWVGQKLYIDNFFPSPD